MSDTPRTDAIAHRGYNESAYIAEMTDLARQLERELAGSRQWSSKLADVADDLRAELEQERAIINATLKALPVGYIPNHTPESLPGRVAGLVFELGRITAMLDNPDEVELAMIRGEIAIPDRAEFDVISQTPSGYNPSPIADEIDASRKDGKSDKSG